MTVHNNSLHTVVVLDLFASTVGPQVEDMESSAQQQLTTTPNTKTQGRRMSCRVHHPCFAAVVVLYCTLIYRAPSSSSDSMLLNYKLYVSCRNSFSNRAPHRFDSHIEHQTKLLAGTFLPPAQHPEWSYIVPIDC